jgi:protoheme IX farnesyltransferase
MLTVTHGRDATRRHVLLYTLPLIPAAIWLGFTSIGGPIYLAVALALNLWFLAGAWAVFRRDDAACAADGHAAERGLFKVSLVYLFAHFAALMAEATPWAAALRDLIGWSA